MDSRYSMLHELINTYFNGNMPLSERDAVAYAHLYYSNNPDEWNRLKIEFDRSFEDTEFSWKELFDKYQAIPGKMKETPNEYALRLIGGGVLNGSLDRFSN